MMSSFSPRAFRRVLAATVVGVVALLGVPGAASAREKAPSQRPSSQVPVDPSADLLVSVAVDDIRLPWQSVPSPGLGVLGTRAADRSAQDALQASLEAQQAATAAAYAAAVRAALRHGPAVSAAVTRAANRCAGDFACFKACTLQIESHGDYGAVSPGGTYRGAWQFDQSTWDGAVARAGYPQWAGQDPASAPAGVQDAAAHQLYSERGNQPWGGRC